MKRKSKTDSCILSERVRDLLPDFNLSIHPIGECQSVTDRKSRDSWHLSSPNIVIAKSLSVQSRIVDLGDIDVSLPQSDHDPDMKSLISKIYASLDKIKLANSVLTNLPTPSVSLDAAFGTVPATSPRTLRRIQELTLSEMVSLYKIVVDRSENSYLLYFLSFCIRKQNTLDWLSKFIEDLKKLIKFILRKFVRLLSRNWRFYHRRIYGFIFKNLDDYHEYSIL